MILVVVEMKEVVQTQEMVVTLAVMEMKVE